MKKLTIGIVLFLFTTPVLYAQQWTTFGSDIYNTNSGNVGIGTATPGYKLDVAGDTHIAGILSAGPHNATSGNVIIKANYDAYPAQCILTEYSSGAIGISSYMYQDNSSYWRSGFNYGSISRATLLASQFGLRFLTAPAQNVAAGSILTIQPTTVFSIDINGNLIASGTGNSSIAGNLGIGTTTPSANLDVNGTTYSRKLYVGTPDANTLTYMGSNNLLAVNGTAVFVKAKVAVYGTPWPDYVFSSTYKLTPLDSLEQFIQINKHLPEVPTAADVEKNGIDLGDDQTLLLKKIEELTLIVIDQNKKIKDQNKRIEKLESKL